jgi:hypothetical protein
MLLNHSMSSILQPFQKACILSMLLCRLGYILNVGKKAWIRHVGKYESSKMRKMQSPWPPDFFNSDKSSAPLCHFE